MIEKNELEKQASRGQTTYLNIWREYCQHLFLTSFYQQKGAENFLFKGGTALRLIFGSPRFSEDLDFDGVKNGQRFEDVLEGVVGSLSQEGLNPELTESKPTSGGYLVILALSAYGQKASLCQEISFRRVKVKAEVSLVSSALVPGYQVYHLSREEAVAGKVEALLARRKPRDLFDLYYILRDERLRRGLKLGSDQREEIGRVLAKEDKKQVENDLKVWLPKSFWPLIKDLPAVLKAELERA